MSRDPTAPERQALRRSRVRLGLRIFKLELADHWVAARLIDRGIVSEREAVDDAVIDSALSVWVRQNL